MVNVRTTSCIINGCGRAGKIVRGMCGMHYSRWKKCGDPGGPSTLVGLSAEDRFWSHVDKSDTKGCWTWTAYCTQKGYGQFFDGKRLIGAHTFALEQSSGHHPPGAITRHDCDNPPCVRPDHLQWGSPADNTQDMVKRGRNKRGAQVVNAKLTDAEVVKIRSKAEKGYPASALAAEYGVDRGTIRPILSGRTWKHVA